MGFEAFIPEVELRSAVTPPIRLSTAGSSGAPSPLLKLLRPTVIAKDSGGSDVFQLAPYGVAPPGIVGTAVVVGVVAAILVGVFLLGRASK